MSIVELLNERRPHRVDAARNFDAIDAAARERFSEAGVSASLEDIARRAGYGVATLYRNFPTRGALLEAVYVAEVAAVCEYGNQVGDLSLFGRHSRRGYDASSSTSEPSAR